MGELQRSRKLRFGQPDRRERKSGMMAAEISIDWDGNRIDENGYLLNSDGSYQVDENRNTEIHQS